MVVLVAGKAVIDDENDSFLEALGEAAHPRARGESDLAFVRNRDVDGLRFLEERAARRPFLPCDLRTNAALHDPLRLPCDSMNGHGVEHFVGDHHAAESLRQRVEKLHPAA
jgi:hypothetical protein